MAASASLTAQLDELIALFNRRSMDLPDGLFTRHTQFLLNGVPFEDMLGRSPTDPLILMLARGPAGYRFAAKAVLHALPDAQLVRGELSETTRDGHETVTGQCWLSGHLRGTGEAAEVVIHVEMGMRGSVMTRVDVKIDAEPLARIQAARLRA
ncbi:MAG: hypothetical protein ACT4QD_22375 [Acidobacteriota bacterium]